MAAKMILIAANHAMATALCVVGRDQLLRASFWNCRIVRLRGTVAAEETPRDWTDERRGMR
ncbi:MAG TPA: hypothetical protein VN957_20480 [Chthoniobacterales bacterium]|nr:hypothetical protein [Chthoniobacterales bacterium]